jgi:hypothetical protein
MKTKDYVVIGGLALIAYLLWKKSAQGGGAGTHGGSAGGAGCGCAGGSTAYVNPYTGGVVPGCPSKSPGFGNYTQGIGPLPPEQATPYVPGDSEAWAAPGFHFALDLSF